MLGPNEKKVGLSIKIRSFSKILELCFQNLPFHAVSQLSLLNVTWTFFPSFLKIWMKHRSDQFSPVHSVETSWFNQLQMAIFWTPTDLPWLLWPPKSAEYLFTSSRSCTLPNTSQLSWRFNMHFWSLITYGLWPFFGMTDVSWKNHLKHLSTTNGTRDPSLGCLQLGVLGLVGLALWKKHIPKWIHLPHDALLPWIRFWVSEIFQPRFHTLAGNRTSPMLMLSVRVLRDQASRLSTRSRCQIW